MTLCPRRFWQASDTLPQFSFKNRCLIGGPMLARVVHLSCWPALAKSWISTPVRGRKESAAAAIAAGRGCIGNVYLAIQHMKKKLEALLLDAPFIETASDRRDGRERFRTMRKRQLRAGKLRVRREYALKKKLGIR